MKRKPWIIWIILVLMFLKCEKKKKKTKNTNIVHKEVGTFSMQWIHKEFLHTPSPKCTLNNLKKNFWLEKKEEEEMKNQITHNQQCFWDMLHQQNISLDQWFDFEHNNQEFHSLKVKMKKIIEGGKKRREGEITHLNTIVQWSKCMFHLN